jgi:hypothetical protein
MQLQIANRQRVKIKMALQGPSGSGKTFSALLLAFGLCGDWSKIVLIDSENQSSQLYSHLGGFNVLHLQPPFSTERYIQAMQSCEKASMEVIIIDSISHEWEGIGGILETHSSMTGNSYTNWAKLTPRHNAFVQQILQSPAHIIGTIRSKQAYVLNERNGKQVPEKIGLKGVTREGMDYEFTVALNLDMKQHATVSKDRTSLFMGKTEFTITVGTGKIIKDWCNEFSPAGKLPSNEEILERLNSCKSLDELLSLYKEFPQQQQTLNPEFKKKRQLLLLNNINQSNNGNTTNK